ncbi:MAG: archaeosortase/exosortase family protein [Candidatus Bathyarchaeota archaeon]|nr:MAG: archaeosortase/exosortase family protein [Candidatus Bathyarchaeota archaeon]
MEPNKYKHAPRDKSRMPSKRSLDIKESSPRTIASYLLAAVTIVLIIYYLPNYFFLEEATAHHTAFLLNIVGVDVQSKVVGNRAFVDQIRIVKDCTGIQVLAVFLGLILPLPNASLKKKALALLILSGILYVANILRITLEFWLVYFNVLPWILAHYPLSLVLGVVGVFLLVLVADCLLPEFGELLYQIARCVKRR